MTNLALQGLADYMTEQQALLEQKHIKRLRKFRGHDE